MQVVRLYHLDSLGQDLESLFFLPGVTVNDFFEGFVPLGLELNLFLVTARVRDINTLLGLVIITTGALVDEGTSVFLDVAGCYHGFPLCLLWLRVSSFVYR